MTTQNFKIKNGLSVGGHELIDSSGNVTIPEGASLTDHENNPVGVKVTSGSVSGSTLSLNLSDSSTVDIDVSDLLDDTTNTISSGVLNGNIITFTREDSSTFDINVSNLYDDTNLVTSVNGSTGAVTVEEYSKPSSEPISYITGLQTALDGKIDDSQVLTNVPSGALFTDTVYTKPSSEPISYITGLQTALDGKTTEAYVDSKITDVVGAAPGALNTLQELGDALGDDANFAGSMTTALAGKVDDSQVLTNVPSGALFTDTVYTKPSSEPISYISGLQTALDGKTTESYVDTQVASIIDSSPATLNTLNELAAALGDDPNYATTVTNSIAGKVSKAGDTMTGALTVEDGVNAYFHANPTTISENVVVPNNTNFSITGPVIIADGYTMTVPSGSRGVVL